MKDMEKAIERLTDAIAAGEKILIFVIMMWMVPRCSYRICFFFKERYENLEYYIPDRYKEGYGISTQGIRYAADNGFTYHSGWTAVLNRLIKLSMPIPAELILFICDHHLPGAELPAAVAILDPKRNDCEYPYKDFRAVGIGFKLIQAYAETHDIPFEEVARFLDCSHQHIL